MLLMKPAAGLQLANSSLCCVWRSLRLHCRCLGTQPRAGINDPSTKNWRLGILEPHSRCPLPGSVGVVSEFLQPAGRQPAPFVLPAGVQPAVSVLPPCQDSERSKTVQEAFNLVEETFPIGSYPRAEVGLEFSLAPCPQVLKKHLTSLFPRRSLDGLTVITLAHRGHQQKLRERLLDSLVMTASEICLALRQEGFWSDFIDPASGRPFLSGATEAGGSGGGDAKISKQQQQPSPAITRLSDFEIADLGYCKLVLHHHQEACQAEGSEALIGSVFTDAPADHPLLLNLIKPTASRSSGGSSTSS